MKNYEIAQNIYIYAGNIRKEGGTGKMLPSGISDDGGAG